MKIPCISDMPNPNDCQPDYALCSGTHNVTVGGVEAVVDFDYMEPIICVGDQDVTDLLNASARDKFIKAAVKAYKEQEGDI
jgi:hypothetical protein